VLESWARRPLLVLAVGAFFGNFGSNSLGVFLVESLVSSGTAEASAGLLLMLGSGIGMSARIAMGWWADRTHRPLFFAVASFMMLGGAVGYVLLATGQRAVILPAIALTFGAGWGWNGLFSYSVVAANRDAPAAATGITQSGLFFGAMAGPGVSGLLIQRFGFAVAWGVLAVSMTLASLCMLLGARLVAARREAVAAPTSRGGEHSGPRDGHLGRTIDRTDQ
jgi:MFS family permease